MSRNGLRSAARETTAEPVSPEASAFARTLKVYNQGFIAGYVHYAMLPQNLPYGGKNMSPMELDEVRQRRRQEAIDLLTRKAAS